MMPILRKTLSAKGLVHFVIRFIVYDFLYEWGESCIKPSHKFHSCFFFLVSTLEVAIHQYPSCLFFIYMSFMYGVFHFEAVS